MDPGTLKMLIAVLIFAGPVIFCAGALPNREIAGRHLTRPQAQAVGAVLGLVLGIAFLLATG